MINGKSIVKERLKKERKKMVGARLSQSDIDRMDRVTSNRSEFLRIAGMKEVNKLEKIMEKSQ